MTLIEAIKESGYKQKHILNKVGRKSLMTIQNWSTGKTHPTLAEKEVIKSIIGDDLYNKVYS